MQKKSLYAGERLFSEKIIAKNRDCPLHKNEFTLQKNEN